MHAVSARDCSRSANATPHSDLGQRIASELAWPSLNRSLANVNLQKLNTIHYITNILKQKSMKKKEYERPTTKVVQLKQRSQILAGSAKSGQMDDPDDYSSGGDPFQF